jgi:glycosyltransferase involved in cell wall biosynthesis
VHSSQDITLYLPSLQIGGAERVMVNLATAMAARGTDVQLMVHHLVGGLIAEVRDHVPLKVLSGERMRRAFLPLCRFLLDDPPSCMVTALEEVNVATLLARLLTRAPTRIVVTVHSTLSSILEESRGTRRLAPLVRLLYRRADVVVAVSEGVRRDLVLHWGVGADRVRVIYNPVVGHRLFAQAREATGEPAFEQARGRRIVAVGRLVPVKRFDLLVRALAIVRRDHPAELFLVGDGSERQRLEQLARDEGVADMVHFLGERINPHPFLSAADTVVLSSDYEGLGAVLIEALAFGVPIVSTDCPSGPSEVLDGGRYGVLVPPGNAPALAAGIMQQLRAPIAYDAREASARFSIDRAVEAYLDACGIPPAPLAA